MYWCTMAKSWSPVCVVNVTTETQDVRITILTCSSQNLAKLSRKFSFTRVLACTKDTHTYTIIYTYTTARRATVIINKRHCVLDTCVDRGTVLLVYPYKLISSWTHDICYLLTHQYMLASHGMYTTSQWAIFISNYAKQIRVTGLPFSSWSPPPIWDYNKTHIIHTNLHPAKDCYDQPSHSGH